MNTNSSKPNKTNYWLALSIMAAACLLAFLPAAGAADFALKFDGTNDFVTFGPASGLGASNFTLEVWFMRQGTGLTTNTGTGGITAVPLFTKGRAEADGSNVDMNYFLGIGAGNVLAADFETFVGGTNKPVTGVTPILNDVWYHAAVTYDGTNWALYLNGSLETSLNVGAGVLPRYDSIQHAGLATTMNSTGAPAGFFAGVLDEARIWNYARSQQEIRDTIRTAITNTPPGLLGRWGLDAGSGTVATSTVNAAMSGILSNGPAWVAGYPFALAGVGGLYFDGDNDYVTFGLTNALGLATFTIETWFKRTGTGKAASTGTGGLIAIPLVSKGRNETDGSNVDMNYFLGITTNNNKLCADFERLPDGTNQPVVGVTTIATGVWYHAAATYDGSSWSLYLNGVLETNVFVGQTPRYDSIQHAGLATAMNSSGVPNGAFQGVLDEVRIWNYARTASQIQSNMNREVPSASGLVARWGLDEEWGIVATNTGSSGVNGALTNGPTWVAGYPLVVDAPPATPVLGSPADGATDVGISPTLSALVSDPEGSDLVVTFYGRVASSAGSDFTIAVLPDTQFYVSSMNGATPAMFTTQTDWIVSNRVSRNIAFVTHLGDCVNDGDSFESQWTNATNAMYRLENPLTTGLPEGIPYGIAIGNHDQSPNGNPSGATTFYNQYFGTNHFAGRTYYGGHSSTNNDSHFELFSAGGMDFVILHLEYGDTSAGLLNWANSVLQTYGHRRAIVTSHDTIGTGNPGAYSAEGQARYNALKANTNWFLSLCGHVHGESQRQDTFAGNTVNTLLSDYQDRANGGSGWMRLLEFSPSNNVINVKTCSPVLGQFETDADSQFSLSYNMSGGFAVIGVISNVPSGSTPIMLWPGLSGGTNYEWYVTVSDGLHTVASSTNHFSTTSSGFPGLVAAYSFDEGTGTTVADLSGNGNNGAISGAIWTNAGQFGNALAFNGSNAWVTITDSASLHVTTGMTLEAWVNPSTVNSAWRDVIYKGNDNYFLEATSSHSAVPGGGGTFGGAGAAAFGTAALASNTWTHLAITYDSAVLRLYVNGVGVSNLTQTGSILVSANPMQIGGDSIFGQYFQGMIDEVRVYNVALTATQIQSDMNTPVASLTNAPPQLDPFAAWQLQYFGCTNLAICPQAAGNADADGDGMSNLAEFQAGTDPTNSVSALRITSVVRTGDDIWVAWSMGPGKTNALQATVGASDGSFQTNNFADIFTVTDTVGTVTNHTDTGGATNKPSRFYRVRLVP